MKITSFFHRYLAARKRKVQITELRDGHGNSCVSQDGHGNSRVNHREIEAKIVSIFEDLYDSEGVQRFSSKGVNWRPISNQNRVWLERKFEGQKFGKH